MIIAVDFDGTLCESRWPDIGPPRAALIAYLIDRKAAGDQLILWTCRSGDQLDRAVMWCMRQGLRFDAVNRNLNEMIEKFGNDSRKVYADEYWDEKSVIVMTGKPAGEVEIITPEMNIILSERDRPGMKGWIRRLFRKEG